MSYRQAIAADVNLEDTEMSRFIRWFRCQFQARRQAFDRDAFSFLSSIICHLVLLIALSLVCGIRAPEFRPEAPIPMFEMSEVTPPPDAVEIELTPHEFAVSDQPEEMIGAPVAGTESPESSVAFESATLGSLGLDETGEQGSGGQQPSVKFESASAGASLPFSEISGNGHQFTEVKQIGSGFRGGMRVKGQAGVGATGTGGAIDRLTFEIMQSLEQRKTLVVWLFDATVSLSQQRKEVLDRFDRIYKELGVIETSGNPAFAKHEDKPLLTSVVAFGKDVVPKLKKPTDILSEIKLAVSSIEIDRSGEERTFTAVQMAANAYKKYATQEDRNVMLIVFTDEVGSDEANADEAIRLCKLYAMNTYVVGVPAAFGQRETMMKWIDPDPKFDQTPQWGRVDQGPESRYPEFVKLLFTGQMTPDDPVDSGYGPFALSRLAYETGGIYFAVHPNRDSRKVVSREETANLSAHFARFFEPAVMRRYRPDYSSDAEIRKQIGANKAVTSLVQAASMTDWIAPMAEPKLHFPKRDDADLARQLTEAQKVAAKIEPRIRELCAMLKVGESDRPKVTSRRWQAGYDLAIGRALAVAVRNDAYNAMLAMAKTMKFKNPKNDTWDLVPSASVSVGSALERDAKAAKQYLVRVTQEHAGTPWAMLAERELATPLGWEWKESYTGVNAPKAPPPANNNPAPPAVDDKPRVMIKPPVKRPPPPL